jgi:alkylation response protein AidB-like acyl-CoA dehydrogenase
MHLTDSEAACDFRIEVRRFLAGHLPAGWQGLGALEPGAREAFVKQWRVALFEARLLAPHWPAEYGGGGHSLAESIVLAEEFTGIGVPTGGLNDGLGIGMLGNTLLEWGTEDQRRHYLPRVLSGEHVWCQGYSEPDAGSDLAGVRTSARLDGDRWFINGQKTWTSAAQFADHIFVLARTDHGVSKHSGMTFFLIDMRQPGVSLRPIRNLTGQVEFFETFFDDAETSVDNVVGGVGEGWQVALTLLRFERGETAATTPMKLALEFERLVELARAYGRDKDPIIRQRLAACYSTVAILRWYGLRQINSWLKGSDIGVESSLFKLSWSEYHQRVGDLAADILGPHATAPEGNGPNVLDLVDPRGSTNSSGAWVQVLMNSRADTIYSGSSEIQRNIIAERGLHLPR